MVKFNAVLVLTAISSAVIMSENLICTYSWIIVLSGYRLLRWLLFSPEVLKILFLLSFGFILFFFTDEVSCQSHCLVLLVVTYCVSWGFIFIYLIQDLDCYQGLFLQFFSSLLHFLHELLFGPCWSFSFNSLAFFFYSVVPISISVLMNSVWFLHVCLLLW